MANRYYILSNGSPKLEDVTWEDVLNKPNAIDRTNLAGSAADDGSTRTKYSSSTGFSSDGSNLLVFVNKQLMEQGVHYSIQSSTQIQFYSSLASTDRVTMLVLGSTSDSDTKEGDDNTLLLMHFDDDTYKDNTLNCKAYPVGSAAVTSSYKKFGDKSLSLVTDNNYFFGAVDLTNMEHFDFGNNEWTVDVWLYIKSLANDVFVVGSWNEGSWKSWLVYIKSDGTIWPHWSTTGSNSFNFSTSTTISTGSWKHLAVVRDNTANVIRVFIDGTECSYASSNSIAPGTTIATPTVPVRIGSQGGRMTPSYSYNGYMDELRISNTARWTSNFTPPTTPYT